MARKGYYPLTGLGHDREFFVVTELSGSVSRQWVCVATGIGLGRVF